METFLNKKEEVIQLLKEHSIPLEQWGTGASKTIDHLVKEIQEREPVLTVDEKTGEVIREFSFLAIDVYYVDGNNLYKLVEDKQVFTDGRERRRSVGVGEKLKIGENDIQLAIARALKEELKIEKGFIVSEYIFLKEEVDSASYPGLKSRRNKYSVDVNIDASQYKPEGYIEIQEDKSTYFVWKKIFKI